MKINVLRSIPLVCGLAALFTGALSPISAKAQDSLDQNRGHRIEGVWDSNVTIINCQTGDVLGTFRGLGLFIRGGANEQTNNLSPALGSSALGHWEYLGGRNYTASFQFFAFSPDGVWTGTQKVKRAITLDQGGNTFSSVISTTFLDVNGNVVATGCGTEAATRVVD
ncbi:MAG: hypothetical protein H0X34_13105 [Chthoniobacterales bacterium]|nr:hypothetical protein [Chthoniobacterales bacterium]